MVSEDVTVGIAMMEDGIGIPLMIHPLTIFHLKDRNVLHYMIF